MEVEEFEQGSDGDDEIQVTTYDFEDENGQNGYSGDEEVDAIRAAAHEDINLITLLVSPSAPGLQALDKEGVWQSVPCKKNTITVNIGDMLQECTQGYYRSTKHRVVNPSGDIKNISRYSMPLFLHPREQVRLSERYTAKQYLGERIRELGLS